MDNNDFMLKNYFQTYLKDVRNLSKKSIRNYLDALNYISRFLKSKGKIVESIYEITDLDELQKIKTYLMAEPEFVTLDTRGHEMYSVGLNNYIRFSLGEDFYANKADIKVFDSKIPVKTKIVHSEWKRSTILIRQILESANFECEINNAHKTFVTKSTGKQYMEGHHLIPLKYQDNFKNSIDIYANIICLCPICHRFLHFGLESDKKNILDKIYDNRRNRLFNSGIELSKNEFMNLVV